MSSSLTYWDDSLTCLVYSLMSSSLINSDYSLTSTSVIIFIWDHVETNKLSLSLRTERKEMKMFIESNFCMERNNSCMGRSDFEYGAKWLPVWSEVTFGGGEMTGDLLTSSVIANQILLTSYGVNCGGSHEVSFSCFASSVYVHFLVFF